MTLDHDINKMTHERLQEAAGATSCGFFPEHTLVYFLKDPQAAERLANVQGVVRTLIQGRLQTDDLFGKSCCCTLSYHGIA